MPISLGVDSEPIPGYRLIRVLGRGGFGEVWEAVAPGDVHVALKFIELETDHAAPEVRALDLIRSVRHPNLLDVQRTDQFDRFLVITMPLCDQSLWDRFEECRKQGLAGIPRSELLSYMVEAAKALDFLNEPRHLTADSKRVGIQHRDVKPHNIFLVGGAARVADFGLAKVLEDKVSSHTGSMTPYYAAPEMFRHEITNQSDQYSLAVSYAQLRGGERPFSGTMQQVMYGHLNEAPNLTGIPAWEQAVVERSLSKDPDSRWSSCQEFVQQLIDLDVPDEPDASATTRLPDQQLPPLPLETDQYGKHIATTIDQPPPPLTSSVSSPDVPVRGRLLKVSAWLALVVTAGYLLASVLNQTPESPGGDSNPQDDSSQTASTDSGVSGNDDANNNLQLAQDAFGILEQYCYACHGTEFKVPGLNVLDRDTLVADDAYIVPGQLDDSSLWQRAGIEQDMPPESAPQPSDEQRDVLRRWILAGAPFPQPSERPFQSTADVLQAIASHLNKVPADDRQFQRYFTLANLHNQHRQVSAGQLNLARAALSKLLNSLSWQPEIVVPAVVDSNAVVLAIDLRDLGWERSDWLKIVKKNPYGLSHTSSDDPEVKRLADQIETLGSSGLTHVRLDWFVATASKPPLYHELLKLPTTAAQLEEKLLVKTQDDFLRNGLKRAGFATSGVSGQNRIVDRHTAAFGGYWKSYDFRSNDGQGNILKHPLGPPLEQHPFPDQAFIHDGGEILFNLPNGLQGYFLTDGAGNRISAGPIDVVSDPLKTAGTPAIVTGLSCMACHRHGLLPLRDTVREGGAVFGEAARKVQQIFTPQEELDQIVTKDQRRFLDALSTACGPFLQTADAPEQPIETFPEPIGAIARSYTKDVGPAAAAAELAIADVTDLKRLIKGNPQLRELGLGPLMNGESIKRATWSSLESVISPFQKAARELGRGTPYSEF